MSVVAAGVKVLLAAVTLMLLAAVPARLSQRGAGSHAAHAEWRWIARGAQDALRTLVTTVSGPGGGGARAAEALAAIAPLLAFAVIPLGGVYARSGEPFSLVAADVDWGVLALLLVAALTGAGLLLSEWGRGSEAARRAALQHALRRGSQAAVLGLSMLGALMLFESWRPQSIALAQDGTLGAFAWLEPFLGARATALDALRLPAWGVFRQPLAFVLCLLCAALAVRAEHGAAPRSDAAEFVGSLWSVVLAATTATLFLGGWCLPYLPTATLHAALVSAAGPGLALGICVLLHFSAFVAKVVGVLWLALVVARVLPELTPERALALGWKLVAPLALANVAGTAWALGLGGAGS